MPMNNIVPLIQTGKGHYYAAKLTINFNGIVKVTEGKFELIYSNLIFGTNDTIIPHTISIRLDNASSFFDGEFVRAYNFGPACNSDNDLYLDNSLSIAAAKFDACGLDLVSLSMVVDGVEYTSSPFKRVQLLSNKYKTDKLYSGIHSWHASHNGAFIFNEPRGKIKSPYKIGCELEVISKNVNDRMEFAKMQSNIIYCETDPSIDRDLGVECISIPLDPADAENVKFWNPIVKEIIERAVSLEDNSTGFHVHIGREALGNDDEEKKNNLGKLLYLYYYNLKGSKLNTSIYGRQIGYVSGGSRLCYNTSAADAIKMYGTPILYDKDIQKKIGDSLIQQMTAYGEQSRYFDVNIVNANTIEFRLGKGRINSSNIVEVITYCDMMIKYVHNKPWVHINLKDFIKFLMLKTPKTNPLYRWFTYGESSLI